VASLPSLNELESLRKERESANREVLKLRKDNDVLLKRSHDYSFEIEKRRAALKDHRFEVEKLQVALNHSHFKAEKLCAELKDYSLEAGKLRAALKDSCSKVGRLQAALKDTASKDMVSKELLDTLATLKAKGFSERTIIQVLLEDSATFDKKTSGKTSDKSKAARNAPAKAGRVKTDIHAPTTGSVDGLLPPPLLALFVFLLGVALIQFWNSDDAEF
jgi:chromosome segregation ATPase